MQNALTGILDIVESWGLAGAVDPAGILAAAETAFPDLAPITPGGWMAEEITTAYMHGMARWEAGPWLPVGTTENTWHGGGCVGVWRRVRGTEVESVAHGFGAVSLACDGCGTGSADFWTVTPDA